VLGSVGPLAGERQSGGFFFVPKGCVGEHPGRASHGGKFIEIAWRSGLVGELESPDFQAIRSVLEPASEWLPDRARPHIEGR
jgi:hypothetical protein